MLAHKIEKRIVEQDVVISKKHLCDKCGIEITRDSYNDEFECKITHTVGFLGMVKKREFDLCQDCANELVEQLSKHEFLLAKPSDKELVEKINIERD